jgi:argininosuccinate lyase
MIVPVKETNAMRERLKTKPSEVMCEYLFRPRIEGDRDRSFGNMLKVNMAHTLMLYRKGIIDLQTAQQLLQVSLDLAKKGPDALDLRPEFEDLYFNVEKYIMDAVGPAVGGRLHTARSRNDLYATIIRMNVRDVMLRIHVEREGMPLRITIPICGTKHERKGA